MGSPDYGGMAASQEKKRQGLITEGTAAVDKAYAGFTPSFYDQRSQAYQNFAMPELGNQYRDTRNSLVFGMANKGLLGGSAAREANSNLNRKMSEGKQQIVDTGKQQAQGLQQQVEASKTSLLNNVYAGADPANATQQATATAAGFTPASTFAPMANMFGTIANQYYLNQMMSGATPATTYTGTAPTYAGGALPNVYGSTRN